MTEDVIDLYLKPWTPYGLRAIHIVEIREPMPSDYQRKPYCRTIAYYYRPYRSNKIQMVFPHARHNWGDATKEAWIAINWPNPTIIGAKLS